ncbi:efflux RND transporter periplasmic adaptor subunit [bacterium]|nr:efflux RND transporter periplasmic adaptor subunit [bacterium]
MAMKTLKFRIILWIIILIVTPILFNKVTAMIGESMMRKAMAQPQAVQVANPVKQDIFISTESAGRIEAKYTVDVVARINGWLQKRYFAEGAMVKAGQTLFLIEPNEYEIAVSNAQASVKQAEAAYVNAEKELKRAVELVKNDYVSKSYYDQALAARDGNKAAFEAAKAALSNAKLNLSYTKVVSPIDGKIGKIMITEGNLVNAQTGPLARIVSTSPIYATFNLKSADYLKFKKAGTNANLDNMKVTVKLADGSEYPEEGKIEFVNNEVDMSSGTIALRATFENKEGLLVPGDYIQVVATTVVPKTVMLIPQAAAMDESEGYYVWVVKEDDTIEKRTIIVSDDVDNNWVVESGLDYGDKVVVKGIQRVFMDGQKVIIEEPEAAEGQQAQPQKKQEPKKNIFRKIGAKVIKIFNKDKK